MILRSALPLAALLALALLTQVHAQQAEALDEEWSPPTRLEQALPLPPRISHEDFERALIQAREGSPRERSEAISRLTRREELPPECFAELAALIRATRGQDQARLVEALALAGDDALPYLEESLEQLEDLSIFYLTTHGDPLAYLLLLRATEDDSPKVRRAGAHGLMYLCRRPAYRERPYFRFLELLEDPDGGVRAAALAGLSCYLPRLRGGKLLSLVEGAFRDPDPRVRSMSLEICRYLCLEAMLPTLIRALETPDPEFDADPRRAWKASRDLQIAACLDAIGPAAEPALPALVRAWERERDPRKAKRLRLIAASLARKLKDKDEPALWLPFRADWRALLAYLLFALGWALCTSRLTRPKPALARFAIAYLPLAGLLGLAVARRLGEGLGAGFGDPLWLACLPDAFEEGLVAPWVSALCTTCFVALLPAAWSMGRSSRRIDAAELTALDAALPPETA